MRRKDREVTSIADIKSILQKCKSCRIGLYDGSYPYVVPVNYGYEIIEGEIVIYFHSSKRGKKAELLELSPNVCIEVDCPGPLDASAEKQECSMDYESLIGFGTAEVLPEEEKKAALDFIIQHYHGEKGFAYNTDMISSVMVCRVKLNSYSAKRRALATKKNPEN